MLLSCKISNAVLSYFETQGEETTFLLESTPLPEEFLKDTSYWMSAQEMESFLGVAARSAERLGASSPKELFHRIGQCGPELRVWGVLDSVIRIMPRPQEIFLQPERLLSYFVSPQPPVDNLSHSGGWVEFDLPMSSDQYPLSAAYLEAAFASLPTYVGKPAAQCVWDGIHIRYQYHGLETSALSSDTRGEVETQKEPHSDSVSKEGEGDRDRSFKDLGGRGLTEHLNLNPADAEMFLESLKEIKGNLARLGDYMVRAQQLVVMLMGQGEIKSDHKEALKRVDWDRIRTQFPETVRKSIELVEKLES